MRNFTLFIVPVQLSLSENVDSNSFKPNKKFTSEHHYYKEKLKLLVYLDLYASSLLLRHCCPSNNSPLYYRRFWQENEILNNSNSRTKRNVQMQNAWKRIKEKRALIPHTSTLPGRCMRTSRNNKILELVHYIYLYLRCIYRWKMRIENKFITINAKNWLK